MSMRQIRKRVEKMEKTNADYMKHGALPKMLAEALSLEELNALEAKVRTLPGAMLGDVLTAHEVAQLSTTSAATRRST
jgi:hypothetical protein